MAYALSTTLVAARTDTTNVTASDGTAITGVDLYRRGTFVLNVSALTGSTTLDVAIQAYINGYWTDIARFAQVTAAATRILWDVGGTLGTGTTTIEEAQQDLAITVSTKRAGPWGTQLRATWTIASVTSITWSLVAVLHS